jgi:hypothetical protein
MHTSNTDDTSREKLRHIIGACMCKDDDKSCWYTNNAQEVENDGTVQDNQVDAILNLIDQHTKTMCERARLDELKQLWNNTQSEIVPEGVVAHDMSEALHKRMKKLNVIWYNVRFNFSYWLLGAKSMKVVRKNEKR